MIPKRIPKEIPELLGLSFFKKILNPCLEGFKMDRFEMIHRLDSISVSGALGTKLCKFMQISE